MSARGRYWFELVQNGVTVAAGDGDDWDAVMNEAVRYLVRYIRDGSVNFRGNVMIDDDSSDA